MAPAAYYFNFTLPNPVISVSKTETLPIPNLLNSGRLPNF